MRGAHLKRDGIKRLDRALPVPIGVLSIRSPTATRVQLDGLHWQHGGGAATRMALCPGFLLAHRHTPHQHQHTRSWTDSIGSVQLHAASCSTDKTLRLLPGCAHLLSKGEESTEVLREVGHGSSCLVMRWNAPAVSN